MLRQPGRWFLYGIPDITNPRKIRLISVFILLPKPVAGGIVICEKGTSSIVGSFSKPTEANDTASIDMALWRG
jgi:hypothetical protein